MPPSTSSIVAGSSPTCPAVKTRFSVSMACEYGPMALGAFSVEMIFLPSDVYMLPHVFRLERGKVILLLIALSLLEPIPFMWNQIACKALIGGLAFVFIPLGARAIE